MSGVFRGGVGHKLYHTNRGHEHAVRDCREIRECADDTILFCNGDLTLALSSQWLPLRAGSGRGVVMRGLDGPRAGVDTLCRLCCGNVVGGPFAGCLPSVFHCSLVLLVRWVTVT